MTDPDPTIPPRRDPPTVGTMAAVAVWGAASAVIAYIVGRGTVIGMVIVFAALGIGQRVWAHWYRGRHPRR